MLLPLFKANDTFLLVFFNNLHQVRSKSKLSCFTCSLLLYLLSVLSKIKHTLHHLPLLNSLLYPHYNSWSLFYVKLLFVLLFKVKFILYLYFLDKTFCLICNSISTIIPIIFYIAYIIQRRLGGSFEIR